LARERKSKLERGLCPLFLLLSPSPFKERGNKGGWGFINRKSILYKLYKQSAKHKIDLHRQAVLFSKLEV